MNTFTVNGKKYTAKAFDFNMLCDLEEMGISLEQAENKPLSMVRAYFSLCAGKGNEFAGNEIASHIISGGKFDDIMNAMTKEMEESDFFRNLKAPAEEETQASDGKEETKKK